MAIDIRPLLGVIQTGLFPAVLTVLGYFWYTDRILLGVLGVGAVCAIPGIAVLIMFKLSNPHGGYPTKDAQAIKDHPGFPRKWQRTHLFFVASTRILGKRALPNDLAKPFNAFWLAIQHMVFEHRTTPLAKAESSVYSQFGEDGVTVALFEKLGHGTKYYVEFGTEDGSECCSRVLMKEHGWTGLLMDGGHENLPINLRKEFVYAENIEALFEKYAVPKAFDFLVIDVDYNDFYIWDAIKHYDARVVCMEFNACFGTADAVVKYKKEHYWDWTNYFEHSITAITKLGRAKGYSLVHCTLEGLNLYFVRDDLVKDLGDLVPPELINQPEKLYLPSVCAGPWGGHNKDAKERQTVSFAEARKEGERIQVALKAGGAKERLYENGMSNGCDGGFS